MTSQIEKQHVDSEIKQNKWGPRFKAAREAMHLTEKDAAARLHLKSHIITIIESERFQSGPPAIFMRGYLKSYAKLLNFTDKEIEQILLQLSVSHPEIINSSRAFRAPRGVATHNNSAYLGWMTVIVMAVLGGFVWMWWSNHSKFFTNSDNATKTEITAANTDTSNAAPTQEQTLPGEPTPRELMTQNAPPAPAIQTPSNNATQTLTPVPTYTRPTSPATPNTTPNNATVVPNPTTPGQANVPTNAQPSAPVPGAALPPPPHATTSVPSNQQLPTAPANTQSNTTTNIPTAENKSQASTRDFNDDNGVNDAEQDYPDGQVALPEQGLDTDN